MARRVDTTMNFNDNALRGMLRSPTGPVGRDMHKRGERVLKRARELVGIKSGRLYRSLKVRSTTIRGDQGVEVHTDVGYARFHHDGTGIFGVKGTPIRPRNARYLRFVPRGGSSYVYAREVRGSRPNPFMREALEAAADPGLRARARALVSRIAGRNGAPAAGVVAGRDAAKIPGGWTPRPAPPTRGRTRRTSSGWGRGARGR